MKNIESSIFFLILILSISSCLPKEDYPIEPRLVYVGFVPNDTGNILVDPVGVVKMDFTDGDGNVGLNIGDTTGIFHYDSTFGNNLFIDIYRKVGDEFILEDVELSGNVRITRLSDQEGVPIEGEIDAGVYIPARIGSDTAHVIVVRWELFLVDRELNRSNVITTPEFTFTRD